MAPKTPRADPRTVPELRARVARAAEVFRKHRKTGACVAPLDDGTECGDPAIGCHLLAQSSQIEAIATDGHVMAANSDFMRQWLEGQPVGRIGVRRVSTFPGFCSTHDAELFRDIDASDFPINDKTAFLLSYRALTRELVAKRQDMLAKQEALGMPPPEEMLDRLDDIAFDTIRMNVLGWRDLEATKLAMDEALLDNNYDKVRWAAWTTDKPTCVVASSHVCPDLDFGMYYLQDVRSEAPAFFVVASILAHSGAGLLHLSWFRRPGAPNLWKRLIRSLTADQPGPNSFLIWMLLLSESVFWSIEWWDNLPDDTRDAVRGMLGNPGIYADGG